MANCSYQVPRTNNINATGDALYGSQICNQTFIDWAWSEFRFDNAFWQGGWGFDDCCNTTKPLARTLSAIWLLTYSADDYQNDGYDRDILHYGSRFVREQLSGYDLRAKCGDEKVNATTFGAGCTEYRETVELGCKQYRDDGYPKCRDWPWWASWICYAWIWISNILCVAWGYIASWVCAIGNAVATDHRVELYNPAYFYKQDVPGRAGTLVHECRHISGKAHDANFPRWSNRSPGKSGCDSSWEYGGAWMYDAVYNWWIYAAAARSTPAVRARAKANANDTILNCFATKPSVVVN
jgi:hypothetical protein